jgi:hypothetical protein
MPCLIKKQSFLNIPKSEQDISQLVDKAVSTAATTGLVRRTELYSQRGA